MWWEDEGPQDVHIRTPNPTTRGSSLCMAGGLWWPTGRRLTHGQCSGGRRRADPGRPASSRGSLPGSRGPESLWVREGHPLAQRWGAMSTGCRRLWKLEEARKQIPSPTPCGTPTPTPCLAHFRPLTSGCEMVDLYFLSHGAVVIGYSGHKKFTHPPSGRQESCLRGARTHVCTHKTTHKATVSLRVHSRPEAVGEPVRTTERHARPAGATVQPPHPHPGAPAPVPGCWSRIWVLSPGDHQGPYGLVGGACLWSRSYGEPGRGRLPRIPSCAAHPAPKPSRVQS